MRRLLSVFLLLAIVPALSWSGGRVARLDPKGRVHVPIGIANAVDTLKTFVEAEGNFSPGFATYGIYFWIYDPAAKKLSAPTGDGVECRRGLPASGYLVPWIRWATDGVEVTTEVCQVERGRVGRLALCPHHLEKQRGDAPRLDDRRDVAAA